MKIVFRLLLCFAAVFFARPACAQNGQADTLYVKRNFELPEVSITAQGEPMTEAEKAVLRYRIYKTWTYAVLGSVYLNEIKAEREKLSKRKFNKYSRVKEKELWNNFGSLLKKFSPSDGRILLKLIYRQTGMTAYEIVKELRSSSRSFLYNSGAWFYDLSLKEQYTPCCRREDYWMEMLLTEAFSWGRLTYDPAATEPVLSGDVRKRKIK